MSYLCDVSHFSSWCGAYNSGQIGKIDVPAASPDKGSFAPSPALGGKRWFAPPYSVRNNLTGLALAACQTLMPDVMALFRMGEW